jgi:quercetin dioxygenase-like cupin family protein
MELDKNVVRINALELKSFNEERFNPRVIYQSNEIKVILAYFKEGQFIPVHTPGVDVVLCILDGRAEVVTGEDRMVAGEKDIIIVPEGVKRGVKALTELTVLHIVQPPPSEEDHEEVHKKIAQGIFE